MELANGKTLAIGGDVTHRKPERRIVVHGIGGALDQVALVVPVDAVLVAVHGNVLYASETAAQGRRGGRSSASNLLLPCRQIATTPAAMTR